MGWRTWRECTQTSTSYRDGVLVYPTGHMLAACRRHKGLAFALMMGREEVASSQAGQKGQQPHHKGHQGSDLSTISTSSRSFSMATRDAVLTSIRKQRKLMHAEIRGRCVGAFVMLL